VISEASEVFVCSSRRVAFPFNLQDLSILGKSSSALNEMLAGIIPPCLCGKRLRAAKEIKSIDEPASLLSFCFSSRSAQNEIT